MIENLDNSKIEKLQELGLLDEEKSITKDGLLVAYVDLYALHHNLDVSSDETLDDAFFDICLRLAYVANDIILEDLDKQFDE